MILEWLREWASVISSAAMLILAGVAVWAVLKPIKENRRMRDEDRKIRSHRHRIDEVENWINEVIKIKSECASVTHDSILLLRRSTAIRVMLTRKKHIISEAMRLDKECWFGSGLDTIIDRLSNILEHTSQYLMELANDKTQEELDDKCNTAIEIISEMKDRLEP